MDVAIRSFAVISWTIRRSLSNAMKRSVDYVYSACRYSMSAGSMTALS